MQPLLAAGDDDVRDPVRRGLGIAIVTLVAGGAAHGRGIDDTAGALAKFESGRAAFDARRFDEALAAFAASDELAPSPNSKLYMGRCFRALGRVASAYTSFRMAAREAQDRVNATGERRYKATRDAASSEAAEIEPKVPRLTLAVSAVAPKDFVVRKNGALVPMAAWGIAVETDPGEVVVEATGARMVPFRSAITLAQGEQRRIDVLVERAPTAFLALRWQTRPNGVAAALDGIPLDSFADGVRELDPGKHAITVEAPGYFTFHWEGTLANDERHEIDIRPLPEVTSQERARRPPKWLFYSALGAGVATLAAAGALTIVASEQDSAELAKSPYSRSQDMKDTIRTEGTAASVLFTAGAVLAASAVVLAFTTWRKEKPLTVATAGTW